MASTVYILGAGINKIIKGKHRLEPPLINDFFVQALKHPRITEPKYKRKLKNLFTYISRYWKLSEEDLQNRPFDLEACFTLLQLQKNDAARSNDVSRLDALSEVERRLTSALAEFLSDEFKYAVNSSAELLTFGALILKERAAVLTFNYDTTMESAIEQAAGKSPIVPSRIDPSLKLEEVDIPDAELAFSEYKRNRPLAYGVQFDRVLLHQPRKPTFVSGERFYSHPSNRLYPYPFLKLHGSLNWFRYTTASERATRLPRTLNEHEDSRPTTLDKPRWWYARQVADNEGWVLDPMIITPVLNKNLSDSFFREIWQKAKKELADCRRLVEGGYSFPPTDFATRRLFIETFADNSLDELVVINPDTSIVQLAKSLCHYRKPVLVCRGLSEFLKTVDCP